MKANSSQPLHQTNISKSRHANILYFFFDLLITATTMVVFFIVSSKVIA